jgi:hypothetical protein
MLLLMLVQPTLLNSSKFSAIQQIQLLNHFEFTAFAMACFAYLFSLVVLTISAYSALQSHDFEVTNVEAHKIEGVENLVLTFGSLRGYGRR